MTAAEKFFQIIHFHRPSIEEVGVDLLSNKVRALHHDLVSEMNSGSADACYALGLSYFAQYLNTDQLGKRLSPLECLMEADRYYSEARNRGLRVESDIDMARAEIARIKKAGSNPGPP